MIRSLYMADANTLKVLNRVLTGLVVVSCVLAIWWSGSTIMLRAEQNSLRDQITADKNALAESTRAVLDAKSRTKPLSKDTGNVVARFQVLIEQAAIRNGCTVEEYVVTGEPAPYISRYTNGQAAGWLQVDVRTSISGSTSGIMQALKSMAEAEVLYEYASLDLQRLNNDSAGNATLTAQLDLKLLQKQEGA